LNRYEIALYIQICIVKVIKVTALLSLLILFGCQNGSIGGGSHENVEGDNPFPDAPGVAFAARPKVDYGNGKGDGFTPPAAGACHELTLNQRLAVATLPVSSAVADLPIFATAISGGRTLVAWTPKDKQEVRLVVVNEEGKLVGAEHVVPGVRAYGLAASDQAYGLLVKRDPDYLHLVLLRPDGSVIIDRALVGKPSGHVPTLGEEWFPVVVFSAARLLWTGERWAAYFTLHRMWPDGVGHQGDTLRFFDAAGQPLLDSNNQPQDGWGWGCSHSLDVRLAARVGQVGPVCISDCKPTKGIQFNGGKPHTTAKDSEIFEDLSGNCAGRSDTKLGGLTAVADGYWLSFHSKVGRTSRDLALIHIDAEGKPGLPLWTGETPADEMWSRVVSFQGGFAVVWTSGTEAYIERRTNAGEVVQGPELVAAPHNALFNINAADPVTHPNGDVGWIAPAAGGLKVLRARACP